MEHSAAVQQHRPSVQYDDSHTLESVALVSFLNIFLRQERIATDAQSVSL